MAKALLACYRSESEIDAARFAQIADARLSPDNLSARQAVLRHVGRTLVYVFNPSSQESGNGAGVVLGTVVGPDLSALRVGSPAPDGSFALFRYDERQAEVLTDCSGSRTIWYCMTPDRFLASTSQRLLTLALGDFEPNARAVSWMLTNGHLGPTDAWDRRVRRLAPGSRLRLDRAEWSLETEGGGSLAFRPLDLSYVEYRRAVSLAVEQTISGLGLDGTRWTLALSGGMDSRSLLYHLRGSEGLETVTWGLARSQDVPSGDAAIAARLARDCGFAHRFVDLNARSEAFSDTVERFLIAGEGRIDHLSGYLDGLSFWGDLARAGRDILRGYDALGQKVPVATAFQVRRANNLLFTADFATESPLDDFSVSSADLPEPLRRQQGESLDDWRDRLWLEFRTPVITAALDDVKTTYVEISNPLLSSRVIESTRSLPADLRTNKRLWGDIVGAMFPGVPFATSNAIQSLDAVLEVPSVRQALRGQLDRVEGSGLFGDRLVPWLDEGLRHPSRFDKGRRRLKSYARTLLPRRVVDDLRKLRTREPLRASRVALRALMATRMNEILREDAEALERGRP